MSDLNISPLNEHRVATHEYYFEGDVETPPIVTAFAVYRCRTFTGRYFRVAQYDPREGIGDSPLTVLPFVPSEKEPTLADIARLLDLTLPWVQ